MSVSTASDVSRGGDDRHTQPGAASCKEQQNQPESRTPDNLHHRAPSPRQLALPQPGCHAS